MVGYRNYIEVGLDSLSQVVPPRLTTEPKDSCLSAKSKIEWAFPEKKCNPTVEDINGKFQGVG